VGQVDQDLYAFEDDVVRFLALDIDNESYAAGIVFIPGVVQALALGKTVGDTLIAHEYTFGDRCSIACQDN
jgi:hypothetical protein